MQRQKEKTKPKLVCTNCGEEITKEQKRDNHGYCDECAFACWGEGHPK